MTQHDDSVTLRQMLDYAREAVEMCRTASRADLDRERMFQLALVRLLEMIGEAATRVSGQGRAAQPDIPWTQIISLRNRVVHGYDVVNLDVVWGIVHDDLPPLIPQLEKIVAE
jgi:uncharacterized protein with HEPN domain